MHYYKLALTKYAVFEGRSTRKEYWMFVLANLIVWILVAILQGLLSFDSGVLTGLYSLAVLVPSLALGARRLHDIGKSGWWLLLNLIPFIGWIIIIVFACLDSEPGANKYGPNPKGGNVSPTPPTSPVVPTI